MYMWICCCIMAGPQRIKSLLLLRVNGNSPLVQMSEALVSGTKARFYFQCHIGVLVTPYGFITNWCLTVLSLIWTTVNLRCWDKLCLAWRRGCRKHLIFWRKHLMWILIHHSTMEGMECGSAPLPWVILAEVYPVLALGSLDVGWRGIWHRLLQWHCNTVTPQLNTSDGQGLRPWLPSVW